MPAKTPVKKIVKAVKKEPKETVVKDRYVEAVGRRKTSTARVRITPRKTQSIVVNAKPFEEYFQGKELRTIASSPLEKSGLGETFEISALVKGGGIYSQAEAVRHAISRALVKYKGEVRGVLKAYSYLTRDPRMRERKKFGLHRARRARQWRKR